MCFFFFSLSRFIFGTFYAQQISFFPFLSMMLASIKAAQRGNNFCPVNAISLINVVKEERNWSTNEKLNEKKLRSQWLLYAKLNYLFKGPFNTILVGSLIPVQRSMKHISLDINLPTNYIQNVATFDSLISVPFICIKPRSKIVVMKQVRLTQRLGQKAEEIGLYMQWNYLIFYVTLCLPRGSLILELFWF